MFTASYNLTKAEKLSSTYADQCKGEILRHFSNDTLLIDLLRSTFIFKKSGKFQFLKLNCLTHRHFYMGKTGEIWLHMIKVSQTIHDHWTMMLFLPMQHLKSLA